ncbi:MAG: hypothetical protein HYY18_17880 [Planctomycetes bacterium]|nr:hypothetical protein [Planctomycetota bacterium]
MSRVFAFALLLACAGPAAADAIVLKDGRRFEGEVTDKGDRYAVKGKFGTVYFDKKDVAKVEMPPVEEYRQRAGALSDQDAEGHFLLGVWCREQGLRAEARAEFEKAIAADSEHGGARRELGHSKIGARWGTPAELLESVEALVKLGKVDAARDRLGPIAANAETLDKDGQRRVWMLMTNLEMRAGNREKAGEAIGKWADLAPGHEKTAAKVRERIVVDSPDGRFSLGEADLAGMQSAPGDAPLQAGRQPLWDERVMKVAILREAAKDEAQGLKMMAEAESLVVADPEKALRMYKNAEDFFGHANEIVPNYGRQHQIESIRKMVPLLFSLAISADDRQVENNPLNEKYEMKRNAAGALKFTPDGLKKFEEMRRNWNVHVGKLDEYLKEIDRLNARFPEELAANKLAYAKLHKSVEEFVPKVRAYFDSAAKQYK